MKEYLITSGFLDRQRKLILTADYLEWENGDLRGHEFARFSKADILDFKHGIDRIVWYKFTVGEQFSITFKSRENSELKIQFNSRFGLRKDNSQMYSDIIGDIWRLYHSSIIDYHLAKFYNEGEIEIRGIKLKDEGIVLTEHSDLVSWDKVAMKAYYNYFAIFNKVHANTHCRVGYNEYGTETLWSVIGTILKQKTANTSTQNV